MLLVGGEGEPTAWRSFDIELQRVVEATLAEQDGTPFKAKV